MRTFLKLATWAWLGLTAVQATAQGYPNKPVRVVIPYAAGGNMEHWRPTLAKVGQLMGQTFYMENKPGAGGNIGADAAAKSPADGYTLVMGTVGTHSINGGLYSKMPYDMVRDFAPVSHVASTPNLLVVNNDLPVKTVAELIAYLKANPNKLSFGSPGIGSSVHVSGELFKSMTGTFMTHIPYTGSGPALLALVSLAAALALFIRLSPLERLLTASRRDAQGGRR